MNGLEISGVSKRFGATVALDDVSLTINEHELFFLLGPSGCGKTTLLRCIAGLCRPDAGRVRFGGNDITDTPVDKRNMGMVFQNYSLWPHMTVFENVAYGLKMRNRAKDETESRAFKALAMVEMQGLKDRKPAALSGGQQQRIALARALVYEPPVVLLDEPLSNLDAKLRKEMRMEIRAIQKRLGVTMVYVTHDQEEASAMADRMALLDKGRIVQSGTPREIYRRPASAFAAQFFGQANLLACTVATVAEGRAAIACGTARFAVPLSAFGATPVQGQRATAVVRPEDLYWSEAGNQEPHISGTIAGHERSGGVHTYTIDAPKQQFIMQDGTGGEERAIGSAVTMGIRTDRLYFIHA